MARKGNTVSVTSGCKKPDFKAISKDKKTFEYDFKTAMYYTHYEVNNKKLKAETLKYMKKKELDIPFIEELEDYYFTSFGKICYISNMGADVPEKWEEAVVENLLKHSKIGERKKAEKDKAAEAKKEKDAKPQPSIQDRLREKAFDVAGEFEGWIDEFITSPSKFKVKDYDSYKVMQSAELKGNHVRHIIKAYEPQRAEIAAVLTKKDPDLVEAYATYTTAQLKKLLALYDGIIASSNMIIEQDKANRTPRKKKVVTADKLVEKLKYMSTFKELSLVSKNPVEIIGAAEVWVYNTKTRKLGRYVAEHPAGLNVKGASIIDFSTTESIEKTLRKPADMLKEFKGLTKAKSKKYLSTIKSTDTKLKGRLNENHIILQIYKK